MDEVNQPITPQVPQTPDQMNSSLEDSNHSKIIPIIIVIIILILVGAGSYILGTKNSQPATENIIQTTPIPSPIPTTDPTSNWKTYTNTKYGYSIKYPSDLFVKDFETATSFTSEPYPTGEGPGPLDLIEIASKGNYVNNTFNALFKANQGEDVLEAHSAIDVQVTKLRNTKFGTYDAVEYIRDGLTPPKSDLGRGPIGYEHHVLIKKNDQEFIDLINQSMNVEKTKQRDLIFNEMVSTLKFTP